MQCPDENTLVAYASGKLAPDAADVVECHMDTCEVCPHLLPALFEAADSTTRAGSSAEHSAENDETIPHFPSAPVQSPAKDLPSFEAGTMVDQFRISRFLARGGMGEVYLARDMQLARKVALKIIHPRLVTSQKVRDRFLLEARALARFSHPHIVTIYAAGLINDIPYMALEYLTGQNLRERLARETISEVEALRITLAICEALQETHKAGILHRDLKSSNVLIPSDGRVRVVDFGLAKVISTVANNETIPIEPGYSIVPGVMSSASDALTAAGKGIQGTPSYMSPEQWTGRMPSPATDIWAVGIMLHEMLAGHRPYFEQGMIPLLKRVTDESNVPINPTLATDLAPIIGGCLEKKSARRTELKVLVEALRSALARRRRGAEFHAEPFRGLRAYPERYARFFYGREDEITAFLERMREEPILPIIGPSGAGKSSFVRAGIIPRLREQGKWHIIDFRPGEKPFHALASRLQRLTTELRDEVPSTATELPGVIDDLADTFTGSATSLYLRMQHLADEYRCRFVIYVDQLEELATLVPNPAVRTAFMEALCNVAQDFQDPVRVILTVRDDFLAPLVTTPRVRQALSHVTMMQSPDREGLLDIIRKPVEAVGYDFDDPSLIEEMVDSVKNESASLALLQFASHSLWLRRDEERKLLRRSSYEEMGGVAGALAYHADGILKDLNMQEVDVAREILLRLVTPQGTRQILSRTRLLEGLPEQSERVLKRLVNARLISVSRSDADNDAVAELAHESLINNWKRLARWLDDSREDLQFLQEIGQAAEVWQKRGRHSDELWSGDALADAGRAAARSKARVPTAVEEFLKAGNHLALRHSRRKTIATSLIVVTLAAVATALALQNRQVTQQQQEAELQRAAAQLEGAKRALASEDLLEARAKFRAAIETRDSVGARMLWHKLRRHPQNWRRELGAFAFDIVVSPKHAPPLVAVAAANASVYLLDLVSGKIQRVLRGHTGRVFSVDFSPDGKELASAGSEGRVRIWETKTGRTIHILKTKGGSVWGLKFDPKGKWIAAASVDKTIWLWDAKTGKTLNRLKGHEGEIWRLAVSPDGSLLASASADGTLRLWNSSTGKTVRILRGHKGGVWHLDFSPDGKWLGSAGADKTLRLWPLQTDSAPTVIRAHASALESVRFSPDSRSVATGAGDNEIRVWDVGTGKRLYRLQGHSGRVYGLRFIDGGKRILSASYDGSVRSWTLQRNERQAQSVGHSGSVWAASLSPDRKLVASCGADKTIRIWRVATGEEVRVLRGHHDYIEDLRFTADGRHLISASYDSELRIWNVATGRTERILYGHERGANSVDLSPDGKQIASASWDGTIRLWNRSSGAETRRFSSDGDRFLSVRFAPDGKTLFAGGVKGPIRRWRVKDGQSLPPLTGHKDRVWGLSFSKDGLRLFTSSWDKSVRLWDLKTGHHKTLFEHSSRISELALHPNQKKVAIPTADGNWQLITTQGNVERTFYGHRGEVNRVRFGGTGELAVTAGDDGTVRLWRVNNARPYWRAPALLHTSAQLYTHQGWVSLTPQNEGHATPSHANWRRAIEEKARFALQSPKGGLLCMLTTDGYLEVRTAKDPTPAARRQIADIISLKAGESACLWLDKTGRVGLLRRQGTEKAIRASAATAITLNSKYIIVATDEKVEVYSPAGDLLRRFNSDIGLGALAVDGDRLALGYREGNVELLNLSTGKLSKDPMENVPSSPVVSLLFAPSGTLAAGYADGSVALWSLSSGALLNRGKLHGPVTHLELHENRILAASVLGTHLSWDLSSLNKRYCDLVNEVWDTVPVVWRDGEPQIARPSGKYPCPKKGE